MNQAKLPSVHAIATHRGAFLMAFVIGAVLMLGVRSLFIGADGSPSMAGAASAEADHHAGPGHEGHAHGEELAPTEDDGHDSHGADENGDSGESHEAGSEGEEKGQDGRPGEQAKFVRVLLNLGNTACPLMGGDVDGETFTEWSGLRVGHCCPGCSKRFLQKPESLLDEVSPKWREARTAAKAIDAATGEARDALLEKAAKRWTVVRKPIGTKTVEAAGLLVDLANEACPVMGGDVDGKTFTEWNGLRVGHCCPGCSKGFLKSPEALLDEVAPDWRKVVKAVGAVKQAKGAERDKALAKLEKHWKVVRKPADERPE